MAQRKRHGASRQGRGPLARGRSAAPSSPDPSGTGLGRHHRGRVRWLPATTSYPWSRLLARQPQGTAPRGMQSPLVIADAVRLASARAVSARLLSGWRPLLWFWLSIVFVVIAGGAVLRYLGPLPQHAARDPVRSDPQRPAAPAASEPPPVAASASAAMPVPRQPEPAAPSPPPPQPAPDALAPATTDQASVKPSSQPLIILHPAPSASGTALAEQLASQLGLASDQVAVGPAADTVPRAIIRFYVAEDHSLARRLGNEMAQLGYAWQIENFAERPSSSGHQPLEIWLPKR